jgi:hypothetical protein
VLAAAQLLAKLAVDQVRGIRSSSTHTFPTLHQCKHITVLAPYIKNRTSSCKSSIKHIQQNHGGQVKLKAKPGEEEPADHLRRRRTS